jgi:hypothetical protein
MNPPLTQAAALTQLKLYTSQTANFTFTDDELTQALQAAWNDPYVVNVAWDSSISYSAGTWQYAIPATLSTIRGLYFKLDSNDYPRPISPDVYEIVNGEIQFRPTIQTILNDTMTIYAKGTYKLTSSDSLTTNAQVNYVINLAAQILLNQLLLKRAFQFLRNDTTTADIVRSLQAIQGNVLRYKQAILREFEEA